MWYVEACSEPAVCVVAWSEPHACTMLKLMINKRFVLWLVKLSTITV
jgi:hypothetical protein